MTVQDSEKIIENMEDFIDKNVQKSVNGVDLTINKIFQFKTPLVIDFDNSKRKSPDLQGIEPRTWSVRDECRLHPSIFIEENAPFWILDAGAYMIGYGQKVTIPMDCVGMVLPRSTLMAGGVILSTALWDSGYSGYGRGLMTVVNPLGVLMYKDARIGQIIFIKTEGKVKKGYEGTYQNEKKL